MTLHLVSYIYITTLNIAFQDFYAKKVKITTRLEKMRKSCYNNRGGGRKLRR